MPDKDWTKETNLVLDWTKFGDPSVDWEAWQQALLEDCVMDPRTGVHFDSCPHDRTALFWSTQFILNSCSHDLQEQINDNISPAGSVATGLEVLAEIVEIKQVLDASGVHKMEKDLDALQLVEQPAENVIVFNKKVRDLATKLGSTGRTPNLVMLVAKTCISCTVKAFETKAMAFFNEANDPLSARGTLTLLPKGSTKKQWTFVMQTHKRQHRSLLGNGLWGPVLAQKPKPAQINANFPELESKVDKLINVVNALTQMKPSSQPSDNNTKCFDCGKPGVIRGHDGCKQPGRGFHLPKDGSGNPPQRHKPWDDPPPPHKGKEPDVKQFKGST